jgi:competence protein ComEA
MSSPTVVSGILSSVIRQVRVIDQENHQYKLIKESIMTIKRAMFTALITTVILGPIMATQLYAAATTAKTEAAAVSENIKVSLNKADAKALMQVKGMSAYKAHAIVAYRNKSGNFKTVAELEQVKGFKHMKPEEVKAISDHLLID